MLAEGDPLPLPDLRRDFRENGRCRSLQGRAKQRGDLAGKDGHWHEEPWELSLDSAGVSEHADAPWVKTSAFIVSKWSHALRGVRRPRSVSRYWPDG